LDLEKELFQKILIANCKQFPIKIADSEGQAKIKSLVDLIIEYNLKITTLKNKFISRIKDNLTINKLTSKIYSFYNYDFKSFIFELKKVKVNLSLNQQDEWEEYFNTNKSEINKLQTQIDQTDREIDQMVYELYGLTEEEIKIVEEAIK
jgi:hypothetical protein